MQDLFSQVMTFLLRNTSYTTAPKSTPQLSCDDDEPAPPNATYLYLTKPGTVIDTARAYYVRHGNLRGPYITYKGCIFETMDPEAVTAKLSWWNPSSKRWEYMPRGYDASPPDSDVPLPAIPMAAKEIPAQKRVGLPLAMARNATEAAQWKDLSKGEAERHIAAGEDEEDEDSGEPELVQGNGHGADEGLHMDVDGHGYQELSPAPFAVNGLWETPYFGDYDDVGMRHGGNVQEGDLEDEDPPELDDESGTSGSNFSEQIRVRDREREKLRARRLRKGQPPEQYTDDEDYVLDEEVHTIRRGRSAAGSDKVLRASAVPVDSDAENESGVPRRAETRRGKQREVQHHEEWDGEGDLANYENCGADYNGGGVEEGGLDTREKSSHKPGRNSRKLDLLKQELWEVVTDIAGRMGMTPAKALASSGLCLSLSRGTNLWNLFRVWLGEQPDCPAGELRLPDVFISTDLFFQI